MPLIENIQLTLPRVEGGYVDVTVSYTVTFYPPDRHIVKFGGGWLERIFVFGVDASGDELLSAGFAVMPLAVTEGDTSLVIHRPPRVWRMTRASLDEDGNPMMPPDAIPDQIRCKIELEPVLFPPRTTSKFTPTVELGLGGQQGIAEDELTD